MQDEVMAALPHLLLLLYFLIGLAFAVIWEVKDAPDVDAEGRIFWFFLWPLPVTAFTVSTLVRVLAAPFRGVKALVMLCYRWKRDCADE